MTPIDWCEHAIECRRVAGTMKDSAARRILLEAADDYEATADRQRAAEGLDVPAYQAAAAAGMANAHRSF